MIDQSTPESAKIDYGAFGGKAAMLRAERQAAIDLVRVFRAADPGRSIPNLIALQENQVLLTKLIKIKSTETEKIFKPWLGRSTFQWAPGLYFDATTNTK